MTVRGLVNTRPGEPPASSEQSTAHEFHRTLPGYVPTPLVRLPRLAERAGVAEVLVKDEADRLGLPSFKILGASWATYRALLDHLDLSPGTTLDALAQAAGGRDLVLSTATDGNHGRAVAWMARRLGIDALIFVPEGTAEARVAAITSEGARCEVVAGSYEAAVEVAASTGHLVVSDTSWPGYETVPGWVIEGYATIFDEVAARGVLPDVILVPLGVGSLGAAAARWHLDRGLDTRLVGVEPLDAACLMESAAAGRPVEVPGPHRSIMAGLNCGRPSRIAWPWVSAGFHGFLAVDDDIARDGMRLLANEAVVSGETGACGGGALLAVAEGRCDEAAASVLDLGPETTVLLLSTEGATDPQAWADAVGAAAPQVS